MLPRRALSAHQGAKRQKEVGDFAVRNQTCLHRPPASSRSAGKFPTPPRLFQGDGGVTRAMKTDDDRVRPTGPIDGAEGPNAAPAPATKRGPPHSRTPGKKSNKNTEQNSACSSSPLAGAALTVTTLFPIAASLPFGQWRRGTSGGHRYGQVVRPRARLVEQHAAGAGNLR